jgi:hypothetical protein
MSEPSTDDVPSDDESAHAPVPTPVPVSVPRDIP